MGSERIFSVGDAVSIPLVSSPGGGLRVGPGPGKEGRIERDLGTRWLVRLNAAIDGVDLIEVSKSDMPIEHGDMRRPATI